MDEDPTGLSTVHGSQEKRSKNPSPMDSNVTLAKLKEIKNTFPGLNGAPSSKYTFLKNASYKTIRSVLGLSLSAQIIKCLVFRASVLDQTSHAEDRFLVKSPPTVARTFPMGFTLIGALCVHVQFW